MADGPLDYDSGYIFESQKGISDRRAAAGFPPGPRDAGQGSGSTGGGDVTGGGGSLIATLLLGALFLIWKIVKVVAPILLMLMWEAAKLAGQMLVAITSRSRGR
jgi:hypothetical protein